MQWRRVRSFVSTHRLPLLVVLILTLAIGVTGALEPLLLKLVLDELSRGAQGVAMSTTVGAFGLLLVAREVTSAFTNWLTWRTRLDIQYDLLAATVDRLHTLPLSFHQEAGVGGTMTKLDRGVQQIIAGLAELTFNVVPSVVYLVVGVVIMLRLDWRAALVTLAFVPVPAVIGILTSPEQVRRERQLQGRWTRIYARFNEVLAGIVTVKSFSMEDEEKSRFLSQTREANDLVVEGVARDSRLQALQGAVAVAARVVALVACVLLVMAGQMSIGTVVAFLGYVAGMFAPVRALVTAYQTWRRTSVSLDTVLGILDAQDSLGDREDAKDLVKVRGAVSFEHVSFTYNGRFHGRGPGLHDISFAIEPGEVVALVGPSGAGKSTLTALLQRLYDPGRGVIRIDGYDLRELKQRSIRRNIGMVLQDPLLFNDTVRANVLYGRPDASEAELTAALHAAHVEAMLEQLPAGLDTIVGERGGRLSTGQRQRITIARAVLKDPPILVLDEATSALDVESEALVNDALSRLVRGRTVITIVHRLANAVMADKILVLRHGRLVESGTHAELVALGGVYAKMFALQAGLRGIGGRPQTSRVH